MSKKKESEFGKGLVYNLVLFSNHFSGILMEDIRNHEFILSKTKEQREKIFSDNPEPKYNYGELNRKCKFWMKDIVEDIYKGDYKKAQSSSIEVWANGASDHLYELECPKTFKDLKLNEMIEELKDKGLTMGHGFTGKTYTYKDVIELEDLTKKIAMLIDKRIGIDVIKAQWE